MSILVYIIVAIIIICFLSRKIAVYLNQRKRKIKVNEITRNEHKAASIYDERKSQKENKPLSKINISDEQRLNELLDNHIFSRNLINVRAELIIINHNNTGNNKHVIATHYFPELSSFYGNYIVNGKKQEIIEVNLDYDKEAIHPDTGERIPGIKRYLRQHAIK